MRLEFAAGECAQVDWGEFGDVFGDGIKIHWFAMVLAHSRLIYIEFTRSEKFEEFIRCHENAFKYFGGITRQCWYDNLTSAVTERVGGLIKFNARFLSYMGHHHTRPHACNVARGNEKGRVEDLIKYIRMNFWPARKFRDFSDLNHQAALWRDEIANQREHRSTRQIPKLHFLNAEKAQLMPGNPHPYDTDEILSRVVPSDFHILYETNRYSVPWTLCGITVTVRVDANSIRVYYDGQFVCGHVRSYLKHKVFTNLDHQKGLLDRKPGATREAWQVAAVKSIGPKMVDYIDLLRSGERSLRTELSRILALATVYGENNVHHACSHEALSQTPIIDPAKKRYFEDLLVRADRADINDFMVFWLPQPKADEIPEPQIENCGHNMRCPLDTVYSWGPIEKLQALQKRLPDGGNWSGPPNPGYALDTVFSPIATFAYGEVGIRLKVKPTEIFVSPNSEQLIYDGKQIESWSYGTPEQYDEIVRDYLSFQSADQWFGYWAIQIRSDPNNHRLFLDEKLDNHIFTVEKLKPTLTTMIRSILDNRGAVYYSAGACRNRSEAFSTNLPTYVNPTRSLLNNMN